MPLADFTTEVLADYKLALVSRRLSELGRKEVLRGKAKFGILGDGKEIPQIALSKVFRKGDFRSGYYRDQTLMLALGHLTPEQFFAQLYADTDPLADPHSAGRQMNCHFATPSVDTEGNWLNLMEQTNTSADISCTAGQMPRALGLALASKKYRQSEALHNYTQFSAKGNEVVFCTIGDASTSEGHFWETINAAGVLRVPLAVFIWDDGFGISVPTKYQTTKGSISELLSGFAEQNDNTSNGILLYEAHGWDYAGLCEIIRKGVERVRKEHIPAVFHIKELTQPLGHSTSGDHRRYKTSERLTWETDMDCIKMMRNWLLDNELATETVLIGLEKAAEQETVAARNAAWKHYSTPIAKTVGQVVGLYDRLLGESSHKTEILAAQKSLQAIIDPYKSDIAKSVRQILLLVREESGAAKAALSAWYKEWQEAIQHTYSSHLYSDSPYSALRVSAIPAVYSEKSPILSGYEVINRCFDEIFSNRPNVFAFGEDVGQIGDVNQGFAGLQSKYGEGRIFDTGIRELTIMGQAIGMAMRGLRPIAEIQYLDYFIYGLQPLSDDAATLHYRTKGIQKAPIIIRTRGHRLEGIWHAGSPIGMLLNALRGILLLVPRNMTQAAGFYNTLLQSDEPAVVIECLNGYRLKEYLPDNIGEFRIPVGVPEVLRAGNDISIVTYGACCRIALEAADRLSELGVSCEIIDVQSLLPFDIGHTIVESIKKTNRVLFLDEDVPGGASAYMLQQVVEKQNAYRYLDSAPATLSAKAHRPAYGSDGDYYSKPNVEDVVEKVYGIMHEADPMVYPSFL